MAGLPFSWGMRGKQDEAGDKQLGMREAITRRDFLNAALVASGAALMTGACPMHLLAEEDWNGYGGVGEYAGRNGNTHEVMMDGHAIRDHRYPDEPADVTDTGETYDCAVVGAGISGLAAALFLKRQGAGRSCLVIDNHAIFGGEAKRNEFEVDGQRLMVHQGSAMWFPPFRGDFLEGFYHSIGVDLSQFQYQKGHGIATGTTPYAGSGKNFGFWFGAPFGQPQGMWLIDPWGKKLMGAPIPADAKAELLRMRAAGDRPMPRQHGDALSRHLDAITLEEDLVARCGLSRETVRRYLIAEGSGSGMGPDVLSAYADYAADVLFPWDQSHDAQMFPGGNAGIARHMVKALIADAIPGPATVASICRTPVAMGTLDRAGQPTRIRLQSTVVAVEHEGKPETAGHVKLVYTRAGKLYRVRAKSVILAGGSWTVNGTVRDLPEAYRQAYAEFHRAPCIMANIAVRNWRFLAKMGISQCQWFDGLGTSMAVCRKATFGGAPEHFSPDSPTVLSVKILFNQPGKPLVEQVTMGRYQMYSTAFSEYEKQIREQMTAMFAPAGFDARRDIAGIILNRWGHAYLSPQPGFFFGTDGKPGPAELMRTRPFGRIAFANTDLAGIMDHRASIMEAQRAVGQVVLAARA